MILFALGIVAGLILALLWIVISVIIPTKPSVLIKAVEDRRPKLKGAILEPTDDQTLLIQQKLDKAKADGIDIRLEDL